MEKTSWLRIRIKPSDRENIKRKADGLGISLSAFVRMTALQYRVRGGPTPPSNGTPDSHNTQDEATSNDKHIDR